MTKLHLYPSPSPLPSPCSLPLRSTQTKYLVYRAQSETSRPQSFLLFTCFTKQVYPRPPFQVKKKKENKTRNFFCYTREPLSKKINLQQKNLVRYLRYCQERLPNVQTILGATKQCQFQCRRCCCYVKSPYKRKKLDERNTSKLSAILFSAFKPSTTIKWTS